MHFLFCMASDSSTSSSSSSTSSTSSPTKNLVSSRSSPYYIVDGVPLAYGGPYPTQLPYCPPPPPPYPTYPDEKLHSLWLWRLLIILTLLLLLATLSSSLMDLILRPKDPSVSILSANATNYMNVSDSVIFSDFTLVFSFHNPNKCRSISHRLVSVDVLYGDEMVGSSFQRSFVQEPGSDRVVVARIEDGPGSAVWSTLQEVKDDLKKKGMIVFSAKYHAILDFGKLPLLPKTFEVFCPDIKIRVASVNGKGTSVDGPPVTCTTT